jgi:hypothetical protein
MNTNRFIDAIQAQNTDTLPADERGLADTFLATIRQVSTEFHSDLLDLLQEVEEGDLSELISIINTVAPENRTRLIAFICNGEDSGGEFLPMLDKDKQLQRAVDIAFTAHVDALHDLGQAMKNADEFLKQQRERGEDTNW